MWVGVSWHSEWFCIATEWLSRALYPHRSPWNHGEYLLNKALKTKKQILSIPRCKSEQHYCKEGNTKNKNTQPKSQFSQSCSFSEAYKVYRREVLVHLDPSPSPSSALCTLEALCANKVTRRAGQLVCCQTPAESCCLPHLHTQNGQRWLWHSTAIQQRSWWGKAEQTQCRLLLSIYSWTVKKNCSAVRKLIHCWWRCCGNHKTEFLSALVKKGNLSHLTLWKKLWV